MTLAVRPLGGTGQRSSILVFGGAALAPLSQREADEAVETAVGQGVNHFDVAPTYGEAELRRPRDFPERLGRRGAQRLVGIGTRELLQRPGDRLLERPAGAAVTERARCGQPHLDVVMCQAFESHSFRSIPGIACRKTAKYS